MNAWHLLEGATDYVWGDVPEPEVGSRDVSVEVRASAVNHIDDWLTRGLPKPPAYPHVAGSDGVGVISEVGSDVSEWSVGDEVVISTGITSDEAAVTLGIDSVLDRSLELLGEHRWGCHGERVVVPAMACAARPSNRPWTELAAYPTAYVTAYRMLRRARIEAGHTVLVTGIGGGVATAALVLAAHFGATVVATSRDAEKRQRALDLGASEVADSSERYPWSVDIVVDSIGPAVWDSSIRALRPGGRFVTCGGTSGNTLEVQLPRLFFKQHELIGSTLGSYREFAELTELVADGLPIIVDEVLPLAEYPSAVERIRAGTQFGKIVIDHQQ